MGHLQLVQDPPRRTLATRLEDRDRGRFAARGKELAFIDRCLQSDDPPASVVHICGPGGIGKSALLREIARRARERGFAVRAFDGREFGPASESVEVALRDVIHHARPLLLLDSYERMAALDAYLRRELLPALPERALVVMAGRGQPDPAWFSGGWESVTAKLDLSALSAREAKDLLAARGLADERVPAIIGWAEGSPLALALAADAAVADSSWSAAGGPDRPEILRALAHRLIETELDGVRPSALGVAVVARTTTPQLLTSVLADEGKLSYRQLSELTVTEPLGDGITLHELVRKALLADFKQRNSELERDLRRRIVDYLYQRACDGHTMAIIEMAHLVEDPFVRWGFGWEGGASLRIDAIRPPDADQVDRKITGTHNRPWWLLTRRFFTDAPDRVAVARDLDDRICGYMVYLSQASAPAFADADPLIGPWLAHARRDAAEGDSVLWHAAVDFTGDGKVQAMLGIAGVLRSGVANPRFAYLPIDPGHPGAREFAQALNAAHLHDLDAEIGGRMVECHRVDFGSGGLLASLRSQVYSELGLPAKAAPPTSAGCGPPSSGSPSTWPLSPETTASGRPVQDDRAARADLDHTTNAAITPATAATDPPNRNHSPAVDASISTLPPGVPAAIRNTTANQPAAGATAPNGRSSAHPPSRQVAMIAASKPSAASGAGPTPCRNTPSSPCAMPNATSTPTVASVRTRFTAPR